MDKTGVAFIVCDVLDCLVVDTPEIIEFDGWKVFKVHQTPGIPQEIKIRNITKHTITDCSHVAIGPDNYLYLFDRHKMKTIVKLGYKPCELKVV